MYHVIKEMVVDKCHLVWEKRKEITARDNK